MDTATAETNPGGEQEGEDGVQALQPKKLGLGAWMLISAVGSFWKPRIRFTSVMYPHSFARTFIYTIIRPCNCRSAVFPAAQD